MFWVLAKMNLAIEAGLDGCGARVGDILLGPATNDSLVEQGGWIKQPFQNGSHNLAAKIGWDIVGFVEQGHTGQ
jgi:hypothetical protein